MSSGGLVSSGPFHMVQREGAPLDCVPSRLNYDSELARNLGPHANARESPRRPAPIRAPAPLPLWHDDHAYSRHGGGNRQWNCGWMGKSR